eukprot:TRINITY_DN505_c0_g1_i1.p2 TRINITY_DN505_c0_g1~~TRINITY_DN505_c0_g1_i1.p2  ORF type:complete len:96 (-),score=12.88 TRINITY_DN505_c0_g1_i1:45-332(-)
MPLIEFHHKILTSKLISLPVCIAIKKQKEICPLEGCDGLTTQQLDKKTSHVVCLFFKENSFGPVVKQLYLFTKKVNSENSFWQISVKIPGGELRD